MCTNQVADQKHVRYPLRASWAYHVVPLRRHGSEPQPGQLGTHVLNTNPSVSNRPNAPMSCFSVLAILLSPSQKHPHYTTTQTTTTPEQKIMAIVFIRTI